MLPYWPYRCRPHYICKDDSRLWPETRDDHNVLVLLPSNVHPQLAVRTNAAAVTIYNIHVLDHQSLAASLLIISDKMFHGVSPATKTVMNEHASSHPDLLRKRWARVDFLFIRHGTIDSYHIAESKRMLRTPFDSADHSLESHRVQFAFLDRARHGANNGDKLDLYEASMFVHSNLLAALRLYKNATLFADRTFDSMATYVKLHAPDQVQHSANFRVRQL